jgi:hypothetical protein
MVGFDLFAPLTKIGREQYEAIWADFLSREFHPDFLLFWIFAVLLFYWGQKSGRFPFFRAGRVLPWRILCFAGACSFVLLCVWQETGEVAHFEDEFSYLYQASAIARGSYPGVRIPQQLKETFETEYIYFNEDGVLVGVYPVGYPLFLGLLVRCGLGAQTPIILFVLNFLLLWWFFRTVFSKRRVLPWIFAASSPFFLCFSAYYFSQALVLSLVLMILIRRAKRLSYRGDYFLSSCLFLVRPSDGLIVALALLVHQRLKKDTHWLDPVFFLVLLPIHFLHQYFTSGDYFTSTYRVFSEHIQYGYGSFVGVEAAWGFNLSQAFENLWLALLSLNETLLGWPQLSLLPIVLYFLFQGVSRIKTHQIDGFVLLLCLIWFGFYFNYFYPGITFGPRFHYPLIPAFFYLSTVGISSRRSLKLLISGACLISFLCLPAWKGKLHNSGGTLSFPLKDLSSKFGFEPKENDVYIVPEIPTHQHERQLLTHLYHLNDPFELENLRFISEKDYRRNPKWFEQKYKNRLRRMLLVNQDSSE